MGRSIWRTSCEVVSIEVRALGYVSPFSVEGHERCEAIGICGEEYPMRLLSEFSCLSGLTAFLQPSQSLPLPLPFPSPSTSSSVLNDPPFVPAPSAIQGGRCSLLDDFVWQTVERRGCVEDEGRLFDAGPSRLCRRRGVVHGAPLSMDSLRHDVACPRCAVETRCVAKQRREKRLCNRYNNSKEDNETAKRKDGRIKKRER